MLSPAVAKDRTGSRMSPRGAKPPAVTSTQGVIVTGHRCEAAEGYMVHEQPAVHGRHGKRKARRTGVSRRSGHRHHAKTILRLQKQRVGDAARRRGDLHQIRLRVDSHASDRDAGDRAAFPVCADSVVQRTKRRERPRRGEQPQSTWIRERCLEVLHVGGAVGDEPDVH